VLTSDVYSSCKIEITRIVTNVSHINANDFINALAAILELSWCQQVKKMSLSAWQWDEYLVPWNIF